MNPVGIIKLFTHHSQHLANMTLTEIKKELYKQAPVAIFFLAKKGRLMYSADIRNPVSGFFENIVFEIPFTDMGDAEFENEMAAKHLIRYIVSPETENK